MANSCLLKQVGDSIEVNGISCIVIGVTSEGYVVVVNQEVDVEVEVHESSFVQ